MFWAQVSPCASPISSTLSPLHDPLQRKGPHSGWPLAFRLLDPQDSCTTLCPPCSPSSVLPLAPAISCPRLSRHHISGLCPSLHVSVSRISRRRPSLSRYWGPIHPSPPSRLPPLPLPLQHQLPAPPRPVHSPASPPAASLGPPLPAPPPMAPLISVLVLISLPDAFNSPPPPPDTL